MFDRTALAILSGCAGFSLGVLIATLGALYGG
jgi:hypothetical protein